MSDLRANWTGESSIVVFNMLQLARLICIVKEMDESPDHPYDLHFARSIQSEASLVGPIYTVKSTQQIKICPGKLKSSLVKISPDSERLHGKDAKENKTLVTFLTTGNLSGLLYLHEYKYGALKCIQYEILFFGCFNNLSPWTHKLMFCFLKI